MKGWPRITAKNRWKAHVDFIDFMILYLANLSKLSTFIALKLNLGPSCKGVKLNTHSTQSQQVDGGGSCILFLTYAGLQECYHHLLRWK